MLIWISRPWRKDECTANRAAQAAAVDGRNGGGDGKEVYATLEQVPSCQSTGDETKGAGELVEDSAGPRVLQQKLILQDALYALHYAGYVPDPALSTQRSSTGCYVIATRDYVENL
ncbi:type I iterative polyketide synthase [Penicillium bovifimosum]|uniref:Type I iterative polyketide synthase n=1 Tax=Penicillium bovifimosum TaxID=126998 RepID=A0A9W9HEX9_9EURO|nr:type I iterative polyketide synthase [Penicillium bovifimosum]KAJ5145784.1 type I iterative polyketide synthase [Penicillium bovifimosum]